MKGVRMGAKEDLPYVGKTLAAAFMNDPTLSWVLQDEATRLAKLEVLFTTLAENEFLPVDGIYIAEAGACVALWLKPGVERDRSAPDSDEPSPVALSLTPDELGRLATMGTAMQEHHPKDEHWYLNVL